MKYLALILLICVGLLSCSKTEDKKTVKLLLDWYPNPVHVPLYVGKELGFFNEEQIDLEILKLVEPPSCIPYLVSKKVDIAVYYLPQTLRAMSKLKQISIEGKLIDVPLQGFCSLRETGISTPKDLEEKVIAGSPDGFNAKILERQGIKVKEFKKVQFDLISALLFGKVDVISSIFWNIEPKKLQAMGKEVHTFSWVDLGAPNYPELVCIMHKDSSSLGEPFRRALQKSIDFAKDHPKEAFQIYLKALPEKNIPEAKKWEWEAWKETVPLLPSNQITSEKQIQALKEWLELSAAIEQ